jgi:hypothetical protein
MIYGPDWDADTVPLAADRSDQLRRELARPLAAARLKLVMRRSRDRTSPDRLRRVLQAVTEAETLVPTAVSLCSGLAPEPSRSSLDLGAAIAHFLGSMAGQGAGNRIPLSLPRPVVGQWNFWLCRRLVRELLAFPLAISDRAPLVAAIRAPDAGVITVYLEGADMHSPEAKTLLRELGPAPRQFHLWLAARLAEMHGGKVRVASNAQGWVGLTATLPERLPEHSEIALRSTVTPEHRRALMHMMRSPISAARLRLRFAELDQPSNDQVDEIEQDLLAADAAIARLTPLTGGPAILEPVPGDLATIVASSVRAGALSTRLQAVGVLAGSWDQFAVDCIVRNLMALSAGRTLQPAVFTLTPSPGGARLAVTSKNGNPPVDGGRRWLVQQLAAAHGGSSWFASSPESFAAEVFLRGGDSLR